MTIEKQSRINATSPRKSQPDHIRYAEEDRIEMCVQLPESLVTALGHYLDAHPTMSWDDAAIAALLLLVMQNGQSSRTVSKQYIAAMFGGAA